jgi:hypothetical protein
VGLSHIVRISGGICRLPEVAETCTLADGPRILPLQLRFAMSRIPAREEAIFTEALALPEAGRASFLDTACGDDGAVRAQLVPCLQPVQTKPSRDRLSFGDLRVAVARNPHSQ